MTRYCKWKVGEWLPGEAGYSYEECGLPARFRTDEGLWLCAEHYEQHVRECDIKAASV